MFWGLIMEPNKKYSQTVKKPFHISMAAIDLESATDDPVQVMCAYDNRKYLLCTLHRDKVLQCHLDLSFEMGTQVSFITNGGSHVHLTGYLLEILDEEEEEDDDDEEEEVDISLGNISSSNIVSGKRAKSGRAEGQLNGLEAKINKKLAALSKDAPPAKKLKTLDLLTDLQDESDEDDSDVDLSDLIAEEDDDTMLEEEEEDDQDDEEEVDDEDEEMSNPEEEEDEEDEDDELNESGDEEDGADAAAQKIKVHKSQANGATKKAKKTTKAEKNMHEDSKLNSPKLDKQSQKYPHKRSLEGGVIIEEIRQGTGPAAKPGKMVQVFYEGRFKSNNKMFDSATKGAGFKFRLGRGEVIKGWDVGISGMKVGGKRRVVCPPAMAYGQKGSPPTIPPNSTLVFEVEMKNVQ